MPKSVLTPLSQIRLARAVSLSELETGARCVSDTSRASWELRMARKYGFAMKNPREKNVELVRSA